MEVGGPNLPENLKRIVAKVVGAYRARDPCGYLQYPRSDN